MKKPRLFYYEEAVDGFVPVPDQVESIVDVENLDDGESRHIYFKRIDMTDEVYDALPED